MAQQLYDQLTVGQELGPWEKAITEEEVRLHAAARGDEPASAIKKAPSGNLFCHPAMVAPFSIWMFQDERHRMLGQPDTPLVGVHRSARHCYLRPVPLGERLAVRGRVVGKYIRAQRYYVDVESCTTDEQGQDIVHSRDTFLLTPVRMPQQ